ncbi:RNA polymerase sigma factor [Bacillus sp. T33-2]|uniref:RNA polymerase sigma factor n=1 Tax=Bacillus sp. T33-2 TaxID=2054168 RepID=UPI000C77C58F|nr:RNA polymerase sigma factor [Bacillus sp. T33-2]PLR98229.1 RNA polymerase subunit sigma [Bacillus sp. T33-2]
MEAGRQIEEWFHQFEKDITNYLVYYTGSPDVEDMVQETFLRAFQHHSQYKKEANPKTWLISIARNTAIDHFRKKSVWQKLKERIGKDSEETSIPTPEKLIRQEANAALYDAINQLKPQQRDVVILRGISELSSKETAEVLGWTPNKVNVTFHRAVQKLNKLLEGREPRGEYIG